METVFSDGSAPRLYDENSRPGEIIITPCGGGVECLHRDAASHRRQRKGSLKSETIKYGDDPKGLGPEKDCAAEVQQHIQKADPSSRQRGRPTKTRP
jgi:hypothetical protein